MIPTLYTPIKSKRHVSGFGEHTNALHAVTNNDNEEAPGDASVKKRASYDNRSLAHSRRYFTSRLPQCTIVPRI